MKKYLIASVLFIVLGAGTFLVLNIYKMLAHRADVTSYTAQLPTFEASDIQGIHKVYRLSVNTPAVLIYFSPDCDHCQAQAREMMMNKHLLTATRVLWLSSAELPAIRQFSQAYGIVPTDLVQVSNAEAYRVFGFSTAPDLLVYHRNGKLAHRFKGTTAASTIQAWL